MNKSQIKVGGYYKAPVSGKVVTVRVDAIRTVEMKSRRDMTVYEVTNMATGRTTVFRSAMKFRCEAVKPGLEKLDKAIAEDVQEHLDKVQAENDQAAFVDHSDALEARTKELEGEQSSDPTSLVTSTGHSTSAEGKQGSDPTGGGLSPKTTPPSPVPAAATASKATPTTGTSGAAGATPASAPPSTGLAGKLLTRQQSRDNDRTPHLEVQALAGTGKTTTVVEGLIAAKGRTPRIKPSPQQAEVWNQLAAGRLDTVRVSAFNTTITDELKSKLAASGLDRMGVEARGVHSLGNQAVTKAFGRKEPHRFAVVDHICDCLGQDYQALKQSPGMLPLINAVEDLVSLCKQTLTDPTTEGLDQLSSRYDIDVPDRGRAYDLVPAVLERCKNPKGKIHFDDMVWLPLVLDLPIEKVDVQIIDESQDLNRMQQELIYRAGHRIIFVGDRHQAIYGFAGADAESMKRMDSRLGETPRGCTTLPLTVTRRCGKAIVAEAQQYVPEFQAHESNLEGVIKQMKFSRTGGSFGETAKIRPWEETYGPHAEDGCLVLCRVNAPIVSECLRFLKRKIKANILGRKVGAGLTALIHKSKADTVPQLVGWLDNWISHEEAVENAKKFPSETRLEQLQDKYDCIMAFAEGCQHVVDVVRKIDEVFVDDKEKKGIRFSSIHKSKGLEARQVFILRPPGSGPREDKMQAWELEQEDNLRYVAVTRAIEELVYVS